jgi:hypothetical protein
MGTPSQHSNRNAADLLLNDRGEDGGNGESHLGSPQNSEFKAR